MDKTRSGSLIRDHSTNGFTPTLSAEVNDRQQLAARLAVLELQLNQSMQVAQPTAAQTPKPWRKYKRVSTKALLWLGMATLAIAVGGLYSYARYEHVLRNPLPVATVTSAGFNLYYPSKLPSGYTYVKGSASIEAGTVLFALQSDSKKISVIEQPNPTTDLMLDSAVGFSTIGTPLGKAYIGKNNATPLAILRAKDTLINISGSPDVSSDVISSVLNSLSPVSKP